MNWILAFLVAVGVLDSRIEDTDHAVETPRYEEVECFLGCFNLCLIPGNVPLDIQGPRDALDVPPRFGELHR